MLLRALVCVMMLVVGMPAHAIVLVDRALDDPEAEGWSGEGAWALSGLRGNTQRDALHAEGMVRLAHGAHAEFLLGEITRSRSRGRLDQDRLFVHVRHRTRLGDHWAWEAFLQQERDPFARIARRRLAGGGIVWTPWRAEHARLDWGIGALAEEERTTGARTTRLLRANLYVRLRAEMEDGLAVRGILYWQPRPDRLGDARGLARMEMRTQATEHVDVRLSGHWRYDARPPQGARRADWSYRLMLGVSF